VQFEAQAPNRRGERVESQIEKPIIILGAARSGTLARLGFISEDQKVNLE
jgi:hypothetical protein